MRTFRTLVLLCFCCFSFNSAINCPIHYERLNGYVHIPSGHVTANELNNIKLSNVKDSGGQINKEFNAPYSMCIMGKKLGDAEYTFREYFSLEPDVHVVDLIDTLINKLNLQDTVRITYYLTKNYSNKNETFFFGSAANKIHQTFILASQAVVDLKRNIFGDAIIAYPSPASNQVSVKLDIKESKTGKLILFNALGQELQSVENHNLMQPYTFKLDEYASGIFYIHAVVDGEFFMKKVVKE